MSWSLRKTGRAKALAFTIEAAFKNEQGCPAGSEEEAAKNALGVTAAALCASLPENVVVSVNASGSAMHRDNAAQSHFVKFEFSTIGDFVE